MKIPQLIALALLLAGPIIAHADGGVVIDQATSGPFQITVFANGLAAGPADLSVMVQDASSGDPVLDADVYQEITPRPATEDTPPKVAWVPPCCLMSRDGGLEKIPATREAAQNKFLYAALTTLPASGPYLLTTTVRTDKGEAQVRTPIDVARPASPASTYWALLLFPPVAVAGFALRSRIQKRPPR